MSAHGQASKAALGLSTDDLFIQVGACLDIKMIIFN